MEKNLKVISFEELKNVAKGELVELPPFSENQPFIARLQRPSMLALVKGGQIPNSLLLSANKLFKSGVRSFDENDEASMDKMFELFDIICSAAFIEPTYEQIKEAGVTLTDMQYMFVFSYVQNGVKDLEKFR